MTASVDIEVNGKALTEHLRRATGAVNQDALRIGMGKVVSKTLTAVKRELAKDMGIAQKHLTKGNAVRAIKPKRVGGGAVDWTSAIIAEGTPIPLIAFKARPTKGGVTAAPYASSKSFPGAFIHTMGAGHRGVYARRKGAKTRFVSEFPGSSQPKTDSTKSRWWPWRGGAPRRTALPIRELYGPASSVTMRGPKYPLLVAERVATEFPAQYNSALKFLLTKAANRGR